MIAERLLIRFDESRWSPGSSPTEAQINAVAGGALDPRLFNLNPAEALHEFQTEFRPKEIELARNFAGGRITWPFNRRIN
jgi:hypothetical protein